MLFRYTRITIDKVFNDYTDELGYLSVIDSD
jgi:hypothetical protein